LLDLVVAEMSNRINALEPQAESGDWEQVRRTAHQIKGSAGSYGFDIITHSAGKLEHIAGEGCQVEEVRLALDELLSLCRRLRAGTLAGAP
jgi:HPt (histidine-containing phosphotransfer) domain-containing protein